MKQGPVKEELTESDLMFHRTFLRLESLERRDAPATLVGNNKVTYQDLDGDSVTVTLSKPLLTEFNVPFIFDFNNAFATNGPQQLDGIFLTGMIATAQGVGITTVATRSTANGGDGFAALGHIDATDIDLGTVTIDGDLGRIRAGNTLLPGSGLKGLTVHSMGRFGTGTGAPDLNTVIQGKLDSLRVKSDLKDAFVDVQGGSDGRIGAVSIGGSLFGGAGTSSGRINSGGDMGLVTIGGNLTGGSGIDSGRVSGAKLAGVKVGGSVIGGAGNSSGRIFSDGAMGAVKITGSIQGGSGENSGEIRSEGTLAGVTVNGSVVGDAGTTSGRIIARGDMGFVTIAGNLFGGKGLGSGEVGCNGTLVGVKIGGSVVGAAGIASGQIFSSGSVTIAGNLIGGSGIQSGLVRGLDQAGLKIGGSVIGGAGDLSGAITGGAMRLVRIAGDVVGGSASGTAVLRESGYIQATRIASLTIGGSLIAGTRATSGTFRNNGAIRVADDLGTVSIGNIIGNTTNLAIIAARGSAAPTATSDVAIASLRVKGRVEFAQILAGFDRDRVPVNADAQIGAVTIGGDWIASSLAAGAVPTNAFFGDADDAKMSGGGVKDVATVSSKIASLTIGGQALGTGIAGDHYGIVAENVGALKIGGTTIPLLVGVSNDDLLLGISGDFKINEI